MEDLKQLISMRIANEHYRRELLGTLELIRTVEDLKKRVADLERR